MIRNLKALGPALVAILAMSATLASTASAETEGTFTANSYPAHIVGEDTQVGHFTGMSQNATCEGSQYTGVLVAAVHKLSLVRTYKNCTNGGRGVTITTNGCEITLYNANDTKEGKTTPDEWAITTDLDCPANQRLEFHVYNNASHASGTWCTFTVEGDGATENKGLEGLKVTNDPEAGHLEIHGAVSSLAAQMHGTCTAGITINYNTTTSITEATIEARNELGEPVGLDIG